MMSLSRRGARSSDFAVSVLCVKGNEREIVARISQFRTRNGDTPLLVFVGGAAPRLRVCALQCGADDVLGRPVDLDEFIARVNALVKRRGPVSLTVGDVTLDLTTHRIRHNGRSVHLTNQQFLVVERLMQKRNEVVRRNDLIELVSRHPNGAFAPNNLLDTQIAKVRKKLEGIRLRPRIHTVHGSGYLWAEERPSIARPRRE